MARHDGSGADGLDSFCRDAHPRLVAAFDHLFADRWLAEELAQESLIRVCERWSTVGAMASPIGWAFHVGRNVGYSRLRRIAVGRRARVRAAAAAGSAHVDPDTSERVAVQAALQQLPPAQREVLVLRELLGMTTAETAEVLGVRADAVRARSSQAKAGLRSLLDDETSAGERDLEASDGR